MIQGLNGMILGLGGLIPGLEATGFLRVVADRQTNRCIKLHPCVIFEAAAQTTKLKY